MTVSKNKRNFFLEQHKTANKKNESDDLWSRLLFRFSIFTLNRRVQTAISISLASLPRHCHRRRRHRRNFLELIKYLFAFCSTGT
jgi:hypothetical protein